MLETIYKRKYAIAAAMVALLLIASFAFPGVRAFASDLLGLFRVQKFAPISVSPQQIALLEQLSDQGLYPGDLVMDGEHAPAYEVESLEAAAAEVGHSVRSVKELGQPDSVRIFPGNSGHLIVNLESARAIMEAVDADPTLLPDSLDGAQVDVTVYDQVEQRWADNTFLLQMAVPLVNYPADVDTVALGQALLQVLGIPESEARNLAESIDWTTTLIVPLPESAFSFNEVTVDGATGVSLSSLQEGDGSAIVWQKEGILYMLTGNRSANELINLANNLQ